MKNILLCISVLVIAGCSVKDNTKNNPESPTEEVYNLDVNGIGFFSGLVEHAPKIDLNEVVQGQKKSLSVIIKNMGTTATPLLSASLSDTKFYITSSTCSNKSLPPNGGSCSLTLNFSAVNKALQPFESVLNFGPSSIPVSIAVISSSGQGGGGSALIKMYDGSSQIVSPPDYSIGSVSGSSKISKVITIKNEGTAATLIGDATLSSSDFYLSSNGCAGKALIVGQSCSVTINFSGTGKPSGATRTTNLSFGGGQVSLSASVTSPPAPAPAQLAFIDGATTLSQDLHLGPYSSSVTLSKTLSIKNLGSVSTSTLSLQLLNNSSGYFTVSNSCSNVRLAAGASCSFSLRVSTSNKVPGLHSVLLKMDQTTQLVDFEKLGSISQRQLIISKSSPAIIIQTGKSTCGATCTELIESYNDGETASLSVSSSNEKVGFTGWTGDCSGLNSCSIVMNDNKNVSLTTENRHYLISLNKIGVFLVYGDQLNGPNPYYPTSSYTNTKPEYDLVYSYLVKEGTIFRTYHSSSPDYVFKWGGLQSSCGYNEFCEFTVNQDFENYVQYFKKIENCPNPPDHAVLYQKEYSIPNDGYLACEVKSCETGFEVSAGVCVPDAPTFSLVSNFSFSQSTGLPALCKVNSPFDQQVMAELAIEGPFTIEEKEQIQTSACNYLAQNAQFGVQTSFTQMNQCQIDDFSLFTQVSMETGIDQFELMNNLYFDFAPYGVVPLEGSFDCQMYLSMMNPTFEFTGGGINLTNGKPSFLTNFNSKLYFGIPSKLPDLFYLAVKNTETQLVSSDYVFLMDNAHPPIVFGDRLYLMGKNMGSSSYKLFYLDSQEVIHEETLISPRNDSFIMVSNGQYLLVNENSDQSTLYKIDLSHNLTVINNPQETVGTGGPLVYGDFFADSYYSFTTGPDGKWILLRTNLSNNTVSRVMYNSQPLQVTRLLGTTNNGSLFWAYDLYTRNLFSLNASGQVASVLNLGPQGSVVNMAQGSGSNVIYFSFVHVDTAIYKIEGSTVSQLLSNQPMLNNFFAIGDNLIFASENTYEAYKLDPSGLRTIIASNIILKTFTINNVFSNGRRYSQPTIYKGKVAINSARTTSPGVFTTPYALSFIDINTFQISQPISLCSGSGIFDSLIGFDAYIVFEGSLYLGNRDCAASDEFELSRYTE